MNKVRIIGAGFSGLSLAYFLNKNGVAVEVIEQSDRTGGLISSPNTSFGIYETAANGFLSNGLVEEFIADLKLEPLRPGSQAKKRFIYRSLPRRWPLTALETIMTLCKFVSRLFTRQISPRKNETIHQWGHRVLGAAATQYLLEAALQGIYAGEAQRMSAELIFKKDPAAGKSKGLVSFKNGMGEMIKVLTHHLEKAGVQFTYSQKAVLKVDPDIATVICTNPYQAAELLLQLSAAKADPELHISNSQLLKRIELRPITTVTAFFEKPPQKHAGFGILFPQSEGRWPLGILQNSHIFDRKSSYFSETWILSGVDLSETHIKDKLVSERQIIYDEKTAPLHLQITRWPQALPHYSLELKQILSELKPMKNIWLHGNYLGGIGLSKILKRSHDLAAEIAQKKELNL